LTALKKIFEDTGENVKGGFLATSAILSELNSITEAPWWQNGALATVSTRKISRSATPISVALVAKTTMELGRAADGTYDHARFETAIAAFEQDVQRVTQLLQGCQLTLKNQLEEETI
jgi:hypothetical protein